MGPTVCFSFVYFSVVFSVGCGVSSWQRTLRDSLPIKGATRDKFSVRWQHVLELHLQRAP